MYNFDIVFHKRDVIDSFHYPMIPESFCEKYQYVMVFSSDDMVAKFE